MTDATAVRHDEGSDPSQVGLLWISTQRAIIVRWEDEPVVEHIESGVTPRRRAVGSVRRGPARPEGGGRVKGHGTATKHEAELRLFLEDVADRLEGLEEIDVVGRATVPHRFAELLRRRARRRGRSPSITSRSLPRRPTDAQLKARFRRLANRELPRRLVGRYRLPPRGPTKPTGKPLHPAAGRRTLRPARLPEWKDIDEQLEAMLAEPDEEPEVSEGS